MIIDLIDPTNFNIDKSWRDQIFGPLLAIQGCKNMKGNGP